MKWKTLDWKVLTPKEMETSHIQNCIKQLRKRITDPADVVWYDTMWLSFIESSIREENEILEEIISAFEDELLNRNL
jgi:hypothetical protein